MAVGLFGPNGIAESQELFLIVNPKSGGNRGEIFLQVPQPFIVDLPDRQVEQGHPKTVSLRIFSILEGESGSKPAFQALRAAVSRGRVRLIVGGGDGSIMWVISEAEKHGVDVLNQVLIGILPLGTGNDFSRAAGWGGRNPDPRTLLQNDFQQLREMVHDWVAARQEMHDVWHVQIEADKDRGKILQVGDVDKENGYCPTSISKPMVNYFSVGEESRLGFDFERHRTKSQTLNLLVYALEGCSFGMQCCVAPGVRNIVQGLYNSKGPDDPVIFDTDQESKAPKLLRDPQMLLVLNINSFGGGMSHFWPNSRRVGVDPPLHADLMQSSMSPGDGKLEVLTVRYVARVVTADVIGGRRVFQGAPLHLEFWEKEEEELIAYCEIDGEFFKLVNPVSATISLKQRIWVLHRAEDVGESVEESSEAE